MPFGKELHFLLSSSLNLIDFRRIMAPLGIKIFAFAARAELELCVFFTNSSICDSGVVIRALKVGINPKTSFLALATVTLQILFTKFMNIAGSSILWKIHNGVKFMLDLCLSSLWMLTRLIALSHIGARHRHGWSDLALLFRDKGAGSMGK